MDHEIDDPLLCMPIGNALPKPVDRARIRVMRALDHA
jgi:hypothetical protein